MPPIIIGLFEKHLSADILVKYPQLYKLGQSRKAFNVIEFWKWSVTAVIESAVLYYMATFVLKFDRDGQWFAGIVLYSAVLFSVTVKAGMYLE